MIFQFATLICSIRPPYLKANDTIYVVSPSNKVYRDECENGIETLKSWGLNVIEAFNLYYDNGTTWRYSGTVEDRVRSLDIAIHDPNVRAIICGRGGYGAPHLVDKVDFKHLIEDPKWLIGYSDITGLHLAWNTYGVESIHGAMVNHFTNNISVSYLKKALFGEYEKLEIETNKNCILGEATGKLIGGNLCLLAHSVSTNWSVENCAKDGILFIEDVGGATYKEDGFLHSIRNTGLFKSLKGVVIGQFSDVLPYSDMTVEDMIASHFGDLGIPVMYGVDVGHDEPNYPLYFGRKVQLKVTPEKSTLTFLDEE